MKIAKLCHVVAAPIPETVPETVVLLYWPVREDGGSPYPVKGTRVHWEQAKQDYPMSDQDVEECERNIKRGNAASLGRFEVKFDVEE
jgi:hypothetical protein